MSYLVLLGGGGGRGGVGGGGRGGVGDRGRSVTMSMIFYGE